MVVPNILSANLIASISEYLPQFLVAPNIFFHSSHHKSNKYERHWLKFWDNLFLTSNLKFESLLDSYVPLKKISKNKLKLKDSKFKNLFILKTNSRQSFLDWKTLVKNETHVRYKQYRNILSTLLKKSKQFCFTRYFQNNFKDLKNTWKEIKNKSRNKSNHTFPTTIIVVIKQSLTPLTLLMLLITILLKLI